MVRHFCWLSAGPVPQHYDLRRFGWQLLNPAERSADTRISPLLVQRERLAFDQWFSLAGASRPDRGRMVILDVAKANERAHLFRLGFGETTVPGTSLAELEQRVLRLVRYADCLPRQRCLGQLQLDLLARDGFVGGRAIGLYPREFALLWRLSDTPDKPVSADDLLGDVWNLSFRPETNSLAVHVSRLRAKLRIAGIDGLIETDQFGGYRLCLLPAPAIPLAPRNFPLDAHVRLREEPANELPSGREDQHHAKRNYPARQGIRHHR